MTLTVTSSMTLSSNVTTLDKYYGRNSTELSALDFYNDEYFRLNLIPSFIYILILMIIGIPGNILVCYIYHSKVQGSNRYQMNRKPPKLKTTDIFILSLAYFDLINCAIAMPIEVKLIFSYVNFDLPWLCRISRGVSMFCTTSTSFVLLAIAVSRFVGIRLNSRNTCINITSFQAKIFVLISIVIALMLSIPLCVLYGTFRFKIFSGVEGKTCMITNYYARTNYPLILTICLTSLHLLFDVIFITLYSFISGNVVKSRRSLSTLIRSNSERSPEQAEMLQISPALSTSQEDDASLADRKSPDTRVDDVFSYSSELERAAAVTTYKKNIDSKKTRKLRSHSTFSSSRSTKSMRSVSSDTCIHGRIYNPGRTTFMLFIVTLGFMLTFAPYCVIALIRTLNPSHYNTMNSVQKAVYQLFLRSYFLSSAINPIIYSFLNLTFRSRCKAIVKRMFKCLFC